MERKGGPHLCRWASSKEEFPGWSSLRLFKDLRRTPLSITSTTALEPVSTASRNENAAE